MKKGFFYFLAVLLLALAAAMPVAAAEGVYLDTSRFNEEKFFHDVKNNEQGTFQQYLDEQYPDKSVDQPAEASQWNTITVSSVGGIVYQRQQLKTATGNDACIISWVSDNVIGSGDNARRLYEIFGLVCLKFPDTGQEKILRIKMMINGTGTMFPRIAAVRARP